MSTISSVQSYGSLLVRPGSEADLRPDGRDPRQGPSDAVSPAARRSRADEPASVSRPESRPVGARIDDLLDGQVAADRLTSDQADELRTILAAPASPGRGDPEIRRDPAAGPSNRDAPAAGARSERSEARRDEAASGPSRDELLRRFVEQLRDRPVSGYAAGGQATRTARSLVFDISA